MFLLRVSFGIPRLSCSEIEIPSFLMAGDWPLLTFEKRLGFIALMNCWLLFQGSSNSFELLS